MQTTTNGVIGWIETDLDQADVAHVLHPRSRWSRENRPPCSAHDCSLLDGGLVATIRADVANLKRELTAKLRETRRRVAVAARLYPR